ncbi:hypothetical protein TNCT_268901 [Trichonephila clavata]|uniref:Uncharacterized protein n=1 Tax=Trichonephila clavata TaxID=2740835 RepID=A0A8X6F3A9_TRICU|nr:hypothetical protein TNCT_268901 [Trichonephila clavata]
MLDPCSSSTPGEPLLINPAIWFQEPGFQRPVTQPTMSDAGPSNPLSPSHPETRGTIELPFWKTENMNTKTP